MPGIVVVTHNGELPKNGGKRLGYVCGNTAYMFGGPPQGVSLIPQKAAEEKLEVREVKPALAAPATIVNFNALPMALHADGECPFCHTYPNSTVQVETTTGAIKKAVLCGSCKKYSRPMSRFT